MTVLRLTAPPRLAIAEPVALPASKSLSNRALLLGGLCAEPCALTGLSDCDDTHAMRTALQGPLRGTDAGPRTVDIGAAGTAMRFLTAYYATTEGADVLLTGSERMRQRPIGILVEALRSLGADIRYTEREGCPPLRIRGRRLRGGELTMDGSVSSQYISALLMTAPRLEGGLTLRLDGRLTSLPYLRMTLAMMRRFGVGAEADLSADHPGIAVAPQAYAATPYAVEGDWSAASYWYQLLALAPGAAPLRLAGLHADSLQGDSAVARYFEPLGVATEFGADGGVTLRRTERTADAVAWDLTEQPDLAQTLVAACCGLGVRFDIAGLHTLRIKETDRIAALRTELRRLGYVVTDSETTDAAGTRRVAMHWHGERCAPEAQPTVRTYDDHRMAMALAPLALVRPDRSLRIARPEVVSKSYPAYWAHLRAAGFTTTETEEAS